MPYKEHARECCDRQEGGGMLWSQETFRKFSCRGVPLVFRSDGGTRKSWNSFSRHLPALFMEEETAQKGKAPAQKAYFFICKSCSEQQSLAGTLGWGWGWGWGEAAAVERMEKGSPLEDVPPGDKSPCHEQ